MQRNWMSLIEAANAFRALGGRRPSRATLWRWMSRGLRGHKLAFAHAGGRRVIAVDAIVAFHRAINAQPVDDAEAERDARILQASQRLSNHGF